ncbi:PAS domain-containing protein [Novosphingobium resinovorum]|uniref:PAS domain-containing protein n=1 Tax=Novosphingobium resinovorum TaxID=158500 RepID=UPI002ED17B90|nr:PAS domain-containing protein [Novosphingobium resinovorum]
MPSQLLDFLASLPIALSLAGAEDDHPLLFVNERFSELTGHSSEEVVGRNCRFLQRGVTDGQAHAKFRTFLTGQADLAVRAPIVNFRKNGTPFINLLYLTRLHGPEGETRYFLGSQFDVSRVEVDRLKAYDGALSDALARLGPLAVECGMAVDSALSAIGDAGSLMAQAQLTLAGAEWARK